PRLRDGEVLLHRVDDQDRARDLLHVPHAAEVAEELLALALEEVDLLLHEAVDVVDVQLTLDLLDAVEGHADRAEVREHAAEPAVRHVGLARAARLLLDDLLRLALGADVHDLVAALAEL